MNLGYDNPDSLTPKSQIHVQKNQDISTLNYFILLKQDIIYLSTPITIYNLGKYNTQIWEPTTQTINLSKHAQYKSDTKTLNNITLNTANHKAINQDINEEMNFLPLSQ